MITETEWRNNLAILRIPISKLTEDLEIAQFGRELAQVLESRPQRVLISWEGAAFASSAALGKILAFEKQVKAYGGRVFMCAIVPEIYEGLAATGIARRIPSSTEPEDQALETFGWSEAPPTDH